MIRVITLASFLVVFAGCERSTRNVEIQPTNQGVKPEGNSSGDSLSNTGKVKLDVSGFPADLKSVDLKISINGTAWDRKYDLQGGSGSDTFEPLNIGSTLIKVTVVIAGKSYDGSATLTIRKSETSRVSIKLSASDSSTGGTPTPTPTPTPPGTPTPSPTPPGTPTPSGTPSGDTDLDISVDIGGSSTPGTPQPQNLWDGKSFKGNSMFNIEPVK
jgi:hypothetical protein